MVFAGHFEAVEHHLSRAIGNVVMVGIGNENQLRQSEQPDSAMTNGDAGALPDVVSEDFPLVHDSVTVFVFKNQQPVAQCRFESLCAFGVSVVLQDPQPAQRIPAHGNRVLNIGFGGKNIHLEPRGDLCFRCCFACWH